MADFVLPVSGKSLSWQPLKIGRQHELILSFPGDINRHRLATELLISRITHYDNREGRPSDSEWREWDEIDYEAFQEEVEVREAARRAQLTSKRAEASGTAGVKQRLSAAYEGLEAATKVYARAIKEVQDSVALWEQERHPLGQTPTSK